MNSSDESYKKGRLQGRMDVIVSAIIIAFAVWFVSGLYVSGNLFFAIKSLLALLIGTALLNIVYGKLADKFFRKFGESAETYIGVAGLVVTLAICIFGIVTWLK